MNKTPNTEEVLSAMDETMNSLSDDKNRCKRSFIAPKLTFFPPKLTKQGALAQMTQGDTGPNLSA